MEPTIAHMLLPRQSSDAGGTDTSSGFDSSSSGAPSGITFDSDGNCSGDQFLCLISSPFESQLSSQSFVSALVFSLVLTGAIIIGFCFLRPYNRVVYEPRAKHADSKHAPPPVEKGLFGWVHTVMKTKESDLVEKVGLDAAVFMRFTRMMRHMFSALAIIGCGILIPLNFLESSSYISFFNRMTPVYLYNSPVAWAYVVISYIFDGVIFYFLWTNYRHIVRLRRSYFDSPEYQKSLHARTLMVTDIPTASRTDDGIVRITEEVKATGDTPRAAIARNVRDLPDLVDEHEKAVRKLEKHLAEYFKKPNSKRPTTKVSKQDKAYREGQEVDAIDYLTARIKELETQIKEVRLSVDKRNPMPYGFASYESIPNAHSVAYAARKGGPQKTLIRLAPKPQNLIWRNMHMMKKQRDWQNFINNLWVALLTVAWIAPNVLIAVFLSNLSHLALVWPAFETTLQDHSIFWSIVQGVVSPAIVTAFYYYLPAVFRRLVTNAGDITRTDRERHVLDKLFSFFVFNNLVVFSLFSAVWAFVATLINSSETEGSTWDAIMQHNPFSMIISAMITVTPYWCSWLLQRNLGAAIDLGQLVRLTWGSFSRRFLSPTPRELIELTAPQPFEYAAYYNYFLFYTAVALCFGLLQPLTLAITALYFWMDSFAKKYMIMYIFVTKYESGGMFWIALFNRVLIATGLGNLVIACLVATKGSSWIAMLACMVPLFFLIVGFKWYCMKQFDDQIHFYNRGQALNEQTLAGDGEHKRRKGDRVGVRFGHPALFKPLMTPMVSAKSQHLLPQIYTGRTDIDESARDAGFSDVYMDAMDNGKPGKLANGSAPFEIVGEHEMDYAHYKDRPDFRDSGIFSQAGEISRPGTPGSMMTGFTRAGTWDSSAGGSPQHSRAGSRDVYSRDSDTTRVEDFAGGVEYPRGYHPTPNMRDQSPAGFARLHNNQSQDPLMSSAARMAQSPPPQLPRVPVGSRPTSLLGSLPTTPGGYAHGRSTPGVETPYSSGGEETSYDYFRRGRGL